MTKFGSDSASLSENIGSKGFEFVSILIMARKRKHFRAQPHELDTKLVVPLQHLDDVSRIRQPKAFYILLAQDNVCPLVLVGSVFGGMFWLRWVCQWMTVF